MKICKMCADCLYDIQAVNSGMFDSEEKRKEYLSEVKKIIDTRDEDDRAPYLVYKFAGLMKEKYNIAVVYADIKREFNEFVLGMEKTIEEKIISSDDPLEASIIYARLGNYIDFGAFRDVRPEDFIKVLDEHKDERLDSKTYYQFLSDCKKGRSILLLCDNCGEIVFDKLFIRQLRMRFPNLKVYAMVKEEEALNDATMEDAVFCGLDKEAEVITNGSGIAGTIVKYLPDREREILEDADIIFSKGQGNYECMSGSNLNIYYSFLCKCDYFVDKFKVPKLTGMFFMEDHSIC